jgi:hypothetical protein
MLLLLRKIKEEMGHPHMVVTWQEEGEEQTTARTLLQTR